MVTKYPVFENITQFYLPNEICSLQSVCNPHYERAQRRSYEWIKTNQGYKNTVEERIYKNYELPFLTSLFYPHCDEEKLCVLCNIMAWGFNFDNPEDKGLSFFKNHLRIINEEPYHSTDVWEDLFSQTWNEIKIGFSKEQKSRFLAEMLLLLEHFQLENEMKQKGEIPDFDTLIQIHHITIGYLFFNTFLEYALEIDVSAFISAIPDLNALRMLGADHQCLVNDIFSFRKEFFEKDYNFNAISALCFHEKCTLQEAINKVCKLLAEKEKEFIMLRNDLLLRYPVTAAKENLSLHKYINGLTDMVAGNYTWSLMTGRYHGFDFKPLILPCDIILDPARTLFIPRATA